MEGGDDFIEKIIREAAEAGRAAEAEEYGPVTLHDQNGGSYQTMVPKREVAGLEQRFGRKAAASKSTRKEPFLSDRDIAFICVGAACGVAGEMIRRSWMVR